MIKTNVFQFSKNMLKRGKAFEKKADEKFRTIVRSVAFSVIDETPVDTGLVRSNWRLSGTGPIAEVRPAYAPGEHLGKAETANAQGAKRHVNAVLGSRARWIDKVAHKPLYFGNAVRYLVFLDRGHSPQPVPRRRWIKASIDRGIERANTSNKGFRFISEKI